MTDTRPNERHARIAARLSGGDRRSTGAAAEIAAEAESDPSIAPMLVALLRNADPIVRMRAADALEKATRNQQDLLTPFAADLIEVGAHPQQEIRWHIAQMIPRLPLDAAQHRAAIALLKSYLSDDSRIVIVEALTALTQLATDDQALRSWLLPELEQAISKGPPSVRARAKQLIAKLK